jgi:hypothetical protein
LVFYTLMRQLELNLLVYLMRTVIPANAGIQYKTIPFSGVLYAYAAVRTKFVGLSHAYCHPSECWDPV